MIYVYVVTWFMLPNIFEKHMCQSCHLREGVCHVMQFFPIFNLKNLNMSLFVIYLLLNLLYLTFVCDQEIDEFYLFICMWPGVDDFLTKTGQRLCQCYKFNFCIFELLWIQMVKETGKTQTNYLQFLLEITPVVSQIGNCGVFKAENIIADCPALLGFSVWWPQVSTTFGMLKVFLVVALDRFVEPAQKRLRLHEMSQGRVRGSRLFLQYSFYAPFDPFQRHWCVQLTKFSLYEQCPIENCSKGCYNEIISTSVPGGYDLLHDTCRVK